MKYIAFFRGINVSGQRKIKMSELKTMFQKYGFKNIQTYIQSGNVLFESTLKKSEIKSKLENAVKKEYGFYVPIEIKTDSEIKNIYNSSPFKEIENEENGTKILVTFLSKKPLENNLLNLMDYVKEPEKLTVLENTIYLYCPNGYGKSKLSNNFIESKLKLEATTRNWKTITKLYLMLV